ncbi:MAG: aspartyl/asparaginyl beta-hydroxylase domain-containing protein [Steroidobacteraceae bacterium]
MRTYTDALARAQLAGRWLDPSTTPQSSRPMVERAVRLILAAKREIVDGVVNGLATLRETGWRACCALRVFLREEQARPPDPRQQPTMLYFRTSSVTYFDTTTMPWVAGMEAQFPAIRDELLAALHGKSITERVFLDTDVERLNLRGQDAAPSWTGYYFYRHGARREDHCAACPATAAAIDAAPLARVPGHGPEVLYSVFTPGTHLLPHRGVTNARLVAHLPLVIPEDCALNVGGELHRWREGKVVVFDDTYEHEAWNHSDRTRVVMIFDVWNPFLTEVERQALADVLAGLTALQPAGTH